jgi:hypothetical protein
VLLNSSSTSSSLIFSPRFVRMYLIWPLPTKPLRSLSKTWKPRMYSSISKGSRKPPGRLRILEKVSKSTAHYCQCLFISRSVGWGLVGYGERGRKSVLGNVQSVPTPRSKSPISASVGFCPHARKRSPNALRSTRPLPRLSKSWKASR